MTRYWLKITLGALLIFAIGMAINFGVRKGVRTVHTVVETADPITIPIRFATFRVDGVALGKLRELKLLRTSPKQISSAEVVRPAATNSRSPVSSSYRHTASEYRSLR